MPGTKDSDLISQVSSGDKRALRELYDRHAPGLRRFVENWIADKENAADIVHETMIDVWQSAERFQGRSSVKSWIYSIARNKAIDQNRRGARVVHADPDLDTADDAPTPEQELQAFQNVERVRACIDALSPTHKAAIQMAFFEDLTYAEVAEIEKCPLGTIKTRIMHAKKLLMRCLSQSV